MRILHISSARIPGDAERHLACLARELTKRGHEVFVALRPTNQWQDILDLPESRFLYVSVRNSFGMLSVRRIARFVEKQKIDILHAHAAKDYLAASVVRRSIGDSSLVLTRHVDRPLKPFHRFALRNVDAAIAVSPAIHEQLALTFPAGRIFTVNNGIACGDQLPPGHDGRQFRAFHGIDADAPVIVAAGELKVSNGQRDLVLAANEIVKRLPGCRFVMVGRDPSVDRKFRRELKRLVKILGLEGRFVWLDPLDDISSPIAAADVMVSLTHAGGPVSGLLGAMAAGVAVVSTAADDLIGSDQIVPAKDPLALAQAIVRYLEDSSLRASVATRLQASVRERFSVSRMADETESVYRKVRHGVLP